MSRFCKDQKRELIPSSNGERALDVLIDSDVELGRYAYFKDTIILFVDGSYKITTPSLMTKTEVEKAKNQFKHPFTIPDRLFLYNDNHYAVYVDGPTHLTLNGSRKDSEIDDQLISNGFFVCRLPYTVSKKEVQKNYKTVRVFVLGEI